MNNSEFNSVVEKFKNNEFVETIFIKDKDEMNKKELAFYRSIDWIKLAKFLEHFQLFDCDGWEILHRAYEANDEAAIIAYIQERFNKKYDYHDIMNGRADAENSDFRNFLLLKSETLNLAKTQK